MMDTIMAKTNYYDEINRLEIIKYVLSSKMHNNILIWEIDELKNDKNHNF